MHASAPALAASDDATAVDDPIPAGPLEGARGEPATCLDALYREESPRLLRSLVRRMANRDEARDLLQEIFCRMTRLNGGTVRIDRPQAYLSRMATNLLRDRAKRASRQMQAHHVQADDAALPGLDQQRLLEARDMLKRVEAAVSRLHPRTREVFLAHRIDGLSYAEIAEQTGLSVKGVEKQMSKAIAKLDRLLDRD